MGEVVSLLRVRPKPQGLCDELNAELQRDPAATWQRPGSDLAATWQRPGSDLILTKGPAPAKLDINITMRHLSHNDLYV
jgi:hypothetical protein